jgi:hypothetical protein
MFITEKEHIKPKLVRRDKEDDLTLIKGKYIKNI